MQLHVASCRLLNLGTTFLPLTVTICSCPAFCLIGDGGNSTSHGVCRHIDDRGIDGDSISRGVGGLVDNRVYGDSVIATGNFQSHDIKRRKTLRTNTALGLSNLERQGPRTHFITEQSSLHHVVVD
jgi:hypothetical protein